MNCIQHSRYRKRKPCSCKSQCTAFCLLNKSMLCADSDRYLRICVNQIERMHSRVQQPCKFIGTNESVYIRKELNSYRIGLVHQHGRRFVLEHQYRCHDVTCIRSIQDWRIKERLNKKETLLNVKWLEGLTCDGTKTPEGLVCFSFGKWWRHMKIGNVTGGSYRFKRL